MKYTVSQSEFIEGFRKAGRSLQFSRDALHILFDYFEQLEEGLGEEMEFDPIGICCEYAEDTPKGIAESYGIDIPAEYDPHGYGYQDRVVEYLEDEGAYIGTTGADMIVYRQF